jgi:hypothetical protein
MSSNPDPVPSGDPKVNSKIHTSIYYSFKCNNIEAFKLRSKNKYKLKFKCSNMKEGSYTKDGNTIKKGKKLDKMISSSNDSYFKDNFKDNFEKAYVEDVKNMSLGSDVYNDHTIKTNNGSNYKFSVTKAYIKDGTLCVIAESNDKLTNIKPSDDIKYISFTTLSFSRSVRAFPCLNNSIVSYRTWGWNQLSHWQQEHVRHHERFSTRGENWFWAKFDRMSVPWNQLHTGILRRSATGYPYAPSANLRIDCGACTHRRGTPLQENVGPPCCVTTNGVRTCT